MTSHSILLAEDDTRLRDALAETLRLEGYEVVLAEDGTSALAALESDRVSAVVTDYQMQPMDGYELLRQVREQSPELPVLLMTAYGTIPDAVRAMQEGATDYLVKPFDSDALLECLTRIIPEPQIPDSDVIARDPVMLEVLEICRKVAPGTATVLLTGASGTGKEVLARYIHDCSERSGGPFVAINCAAIPENMLEAVLFGHEKGAFTGAHAARPGKFEQAQGGTLLLDEVTEMDLNLQAKLLRVLQEKEVERIGAKQAIALDVRVIATSNRDISHYVAEGRLREDLFYRLSVFPLALPPLSERPGDILPLASHFLAAAGGDHSKKPTLSQEAEARLLEHDWPGNVRELQNVMQRAAILCAGNRVEVTDLRFESPDFAPSSPSPEHIAVSGAAGGGPLQDNLQNVESNLIRDAIRQGGGSRKRAAEILGISPRTLRYKIARLREAGIQMPRRGDSATVANVDPGRGIGKRM